MTVNFGKWKSCATEKPEKDGVYLVIGFYKGKFVYAASLSYSVKYGWNVHIDSKGVAHTDSRIDFSDDTERGYRIWCDMTEFVEVEENG